MISNDTKRRILEIRQQLLNSGGEDDEKLLQELNLITTHPEPTDIIFNMEDYSEDEFFDKLLNYQPKILP